MFKVSRTLPVAEQIEIIGIGDLHNGAPNCRFDKFQRQIEYIKNTPNAYMIGMGDYLDCILPSDKRFNAMDSFRSIDTLKKEVYSVLEPIQDKIIVLLTGNHEMKIARAGYGDPTAWLCQELEVEYGGISSYIKLKCVPKTHEPSLIIYAHHGWTAGRQTGNAINNIERLAQDYDADVYLVGHSHKLWVTRRVRIYFKSEDNKIGHKKLIFANTGTFLETASMGTIGYGEQAGYPPLKLGSPKIKWYPKRKAGSNLYASE